jgi:HAD superfamily phosphatase (TIGR01668 family)
MIKINRPHKFYPNYIAESVLDISAKELKSAGCTHLVFDIDETLVPRRHDKLTKRVKDHVHGLQKAGITVLIGSNTPRDLTSISKPLGAQVVFPSRTVFKPLTSYYNRVVKTAGVPKTKVIMVGDRIMNDIIGANHAGLTTIQVKPFKRQQGPLLKRYIRAALKR